LKSRQQQQQQQHKNGQDNGTPGQYLRVSMKLVTSPFAWRVSKGTVKPANAIVVLQQPRRLVLNIPFAHQDFPLFVISSQNFLKPDCVRVYVVVFNLLVNLKRTITKKLLTD
jgi:hypothetical protein